MLPSGLPVSIPLFFACYQYGHTGTSQAAGK
jgi:hypothetical protein